MNGEYFQELLQDLEILLASDSFREIQSDLMGENLLSQLTTQFDPNNKIDVNQAISVAYRIEQIAIRLWENSNDGDFSTEAIDAFEKAAKLFEYLADLKQINDAEIARSLHFHSAVNFSLGEFQANAVVIARKALGKFEFDDTVGGKLDKCSFLLLQKRILQIQNECKNLNDLKQNLDTQQEGDIVNDNFLERLEDIANLLSSEAILSFSRYLQSGLYEDLERAKSKISSSMGIFNEIRDPENYIFTKLISLLFRQIHFASVWHQLGDLQDFRGNPILTRYLRILTNSKKPIYELWRSQIGCLNHVLKQSPATVISMPTSAGKTRIAELKIVHTLAADQDEKAKCIYIAPYKALAAQIENSLLDYFTDVGYRVSSIFGSYESTDVDDLLIEYSDVLVMTPEKLDYLYRQQPELFTDVKLLVIDEGHLLDNDERGLRLEILLYRLKTKFGFQMLFISAVIPNGSEIAEWLGKGKINELERKWKPTKLRQGIFYWDKNWRGRIRYIDEEIEIYTSIQREIIQTHHKNNPNILLKNPRWYPETKYEIAIELATRYSVATPTIIFTAVRSHVDSIAKSLSKKLKSDVFDLNESHNDNRETLAKRIEDTLGRNFPLAKFVRQGFAYHHGLVPDDIRLDIEEAFKKGYLSILIATPTLAQGVNLPVKLMLVAHLNRGENFPFLVRDFRNIAGRVGRALRETEGQVILIQKTQFSNVIEQNYKFLQDSQMEPVRSVLLKLYERLLSHHFGMNLKEYLQHGFEHDEFPNEENPSDSLELEFQTQLLSIIYEDLVQNADEEDDISELLDNLLFGSQCRQKHIPTQPFKKYVQKQIAMIFTRLENPTRRAVYYRTGLSISSCEKLELRIREKLAEDTFIELRDSQNKLDKDKLQSIFELVEIPLKTRSGFGISKENLNMAMLLWIKHHTIIEICQMIENPFFENPLSVSDLIYKHFITNAPWALNSVIKILSFLKDEEQITFDSELSFLPAYLKFGVDSPIATYMLGLNVGDRVTAKAFSEYYEQNVDRNIPSMQKYFYWMSDLTQDELSLIIEDEKIRNEITTQISKYKDKARPSEFFANPERIDFQTFIVGVQFGNKLEVANELDVGEKLILERDASNEYDYYALKILNSKHQELGFIRRSKAFILSTLIDEGHQFSAQVIRIYPVSRELRRRFLIQVKYDYY